MDTESAVVRERIGFTNDDGEQLAALLERPEDEAHAYALFAHCFTCSKNVSAASRISRSLAARGIAVLRFDFTGLGNSEGDFANTNFSSNVADLLAASRHLGEIAGGPQLMIGHSLGGAAVLAAAPRVASCEGVITIGAPGDPAHVSHLFASSRAEIESSGKAEVVLGGRTFTIRKQFLDDIESHDLAASIREMRKALLVLHSPLDDTVAIDNARQIFEAARHPKSFVSLDGADHLLTRNEDAAYVAALITAWATRYLPAPEVVEQAAAEEGEVLVSELEGFTQQVRVGRHSLYADEPVSVGGKDRGPSPYDYLLAGLGACTSMTLRLYARQKKIDLQHVAVRLRHDKVHARDCEDCETRDGRIDVIERDIELSGDLTGEQRTRLMQIADRCPVHRTLHSEVKVNSRLVEP